MIKLCRVIGCLLLCLPAISHASELRVLVDMLHENGTINEAQYQRLLAELDQGQQKSQAEKQLLETQLEAVQPKPTDVTISLKNGLRIQSNDGAFETRFTGRFMFDAANYRGEPEMGDGTNIRRARFAIQGRLYHDWGYRLDYDFSNGGRMRDSYVAYYGFEDSRIRIGLLEIPFQLQYRTSSSSSQLIERSLLGAFGGDRYLGVMADTKKRHWSATAGLYGETAGQQNPVIDEGWGYGIRLTAAPINNERDRLLHFGIATKYRDVSDVGVVRFSEQPEARVAGYKVVDTGDINNSRNFTRYGLEWAMVNGRFSAQSEYVYTTVQRRDATDLSFSGWHIQSGWFLTQDALKYSRGEFAAVAPNKRVGAGGIGAWELALRYSHLNLNDKHIRGGEIDNLTFGINWYPIPMLRFSANYIRTLEMNGGPHDGQKPEVFLVRSQWAF